ncbi:MAG: hypothetical protein ABIT08_12930 [Bacteroidia bacterium]
MTEVKLFEEIKKLGSLFKTLSSISDNPFVLFPSEDSNYEMPSGQYFEIIQLIFNNRFPLKAICN